MGNEAEHGQVVEARVTSWGKSRDWPSWSWGLHICSIILWKGSGHEVVKRTGQVAYVSHLLSTNKVCVPQNPPTAGLEQGGVLAEGPDACSFSPSLWT